jgi:hypothetical protein
MADRNEYRLRWVSQGQTDWTGWWVARYGQTKSHTPTEEEHVSFANFDLEQAGMPRIHNNGRIRAISLSGSELPRATRILEKHGFMVIDEGFSR